MAGRILVVDDDVDFLTQMQMQLEVLGFEVVTAETSTAAREIVARQRPDAVVLDLMMEQPDTGFTLSYHLKQMHPDLPVIIVTSVTATTGFNFDATTAEERAWIKADALLEKPLRMEQLEAELKRLLRK